MGKGESLGGAGLGLFWVWFLDSGGEIGFALGLIGFVFLGCWEGEIGLGSVWGFWDWVRFA